jgi:hypothetical protein
MMKTSNNPILKIISGGQTGVDRAALDFALGNGFACGGWCPAGRKAEDGPIPESYPLRESPVESYEVRTRMNVTEAGGSLIIHKGTMDRGTDLCHRYCLEYGKPVFVIDLSGSYSKEAFMQWCRENKVSVLNIAGPRESNAEGIGRETKTLLEKILK